ncbi:LysR family transcriptional regulator [Herbaspirillum lusitanum]|uniref:LysR family transcriptional regulator n=1 Tax=Herbaspirillum lusitanum TaxID=213312 RepID=UPI00138A1D82|nr:LysR family transcriptional regulator [Herbaspirillum lusitanum]
MFIAVVETGSLAKAAERENIAPSALSRRISDLEELVGTSLLDRHNNGARVTPAGETLERYARSVFLTFERMRVELSEHGKGERGHVRLFSNSSGIMDSLSTYLQVFLSAHPAVAIHLEEWSSPYIVRAVREGTADLGIINAAVPHEGLMTFPYNSYRLVLVAPASHPLARREQVDFSETLAYDQVGFHNGSAIFSLASRAAQANGQQLKIRMQVTSFDAVREMVRANIGIAILPEFAAAPYAQSMGYAWVPLSDSWAAIELKICVRDIDTIPSAARKLVSHLTDAAHAV